MAKTQKIDIHNYDAKIESALKNLKTDSRLTAKNKKVLHDYYKHSVAYGLSKARVLHNFKFARSIAAKFKKDFDKITLSDVEGFLVTLENSKYSIWTKHDYKVALKSFYKWYQGNGEEYPEIVRKIKTTDKNTQRQMPEEVLTEDDIKNLILKCTHPRDAAMCASLYDSGTRVGELLSRQIKHLTFDKLGGILLVDGKTGTRRIRLIPSVPYLKQWLDAHPDRDNSNAMLWIGIGNANKGQPMTYASLVMMLRRLGKISNITKAVNPHSFRHARATFLANKLTEAQMCEFFGWVLGSDQPSTYVHLSGRDMDDAVCSIYGVLPKDAIEKKEKEALKSKTCPTCKQSDIAATNKFCGRCGYVFNEDLALLVDQLQTTREVFLNQVFNVSEVKQKAKEAINQNPDFKKTMTELVKLQNEIKKMENRGEA